MQIDIYNLIKEIQQLCNMIYRADSFTEYDKIQYSIDSLMGAYKILTGKKIDIKIPINPYYESMMKSKETYSYKLIKKYIDDIDRHIRISQSVLKTFKDTDFVFYDRIYTQTKLREHDMIDLIRTFLVSYDIELDKLFMSMRDGLIHKNMNRSYCTDLTVNVPKLLKSYIIIDNNPTIEGATTIIHELAHAYFNRLFDTLSYKQIVKTDGDYYIEIFSMYLEKVFIDYLIKNNVRTRDAYFSENSFFDTIQEFFTIIQELKGSIEREYIDDIDSENICDSLVYSYGGLISLELVNKYEQDDIETKKSVKRFITKQGILTDEELLSVVDITCDDLESCKVLKKKLASHNKNMKEITKKY